MEIFTGERAIPDMVRPRNLRHAKAEFGLPYNNTIAIWQEHVSRYRFARQFTKGKKVLDVASGCGYGKGILRPRDYTGVDIDHPTVVKASRKVSGNFAQADASNLPFPDNSFDSVVSFETIEHLPLEGACQMLHEIDRVLIPGGKLVISTPNRVFSSPGTTLKDGPRNPFHEFEMDRVEWQNTLSAVFDDTEHFGQGDRQYWNLGQFTGYGMIAQNALGYTGIVRPIDYYDEFGGPSYFVSVCSNEL